MSSPIDTIGQASAATASVADATDLGAIFVCKQMFIHFLETTGHFILFPIAAGIALLQSFLAWRRVYLDGGKDKNKIVNAIVETLVALTITAAVIIALTMATVIAPIMFTAAVAFKSVYHLGNSLYYLSKALLTRPIYNDEDSLDGQGYYPPERAEYFDKAKHNAAVGIITFGIASAILAVMVLGHVKLAIAIGIPVASTAVGYGLFRLYEAFTKPADVTTSLFKSDLNSSINEDLREDISPSVSPEPTSKVLDRETVAAIHARQRADQPSKIGALLRTPFTLIGSCFGGSRPEDRGYQAVSAIDPDLSSTRLGR